MMYTEKQWEILSERFNKMSFLGKLMLIKQHPTIFKLEEDNSWFMLRLNCEEAMTNEYDMLFEFPNELSSSDIRNLFWLGDIKLY